MEIKCPKCGKEVASSSININTDLGKCDYCENVFKLSESISSSDFSKLSSPPNGSRIIITKEVDSVEITLPAKKFCASDIFPLFFSIFWLGFVTFWTVGAAQGSIIFALFSVPFWIVGITMIVNLVNSFNEDHILTLHKDKLELNKSRPINSKNCSVKYGDIYSIKMSDLKMNNPFSMAANFRIMSKFNMMGIQTPAINFGNETINFFEFASDAEQDWIIKLINAVLKRTRADL